MCQTTDEPGADRVRLVYTATLSRAVAVAPGSSVPGSGGKPSTVFKCQDEDAGDLPSPTRDDWLLRIGTWLESDAEARRWIAGFAYFHALHTNDWRFADQTGLNSSGRDGWRDVFVVDSACNDALGGHDYFARYGFNNL